MKKLYILPLKAPVFILGLLLSFGTGAFAQVTPIDTIKPGKGDPKEQLKQIKAAKVNQLSDSAATQPKKSPLIDTTVRNKYGDLLNDDIKFNPKYPFWKPAVEVLGVNVFTNALDRALGEDFSHVGPSTWNYNFNKGWEWDS
ncbi:MAG: hypothetical protein ABJA76_01630, partial [Mucilaginibacter sp.]